MPYKRDRSPFWQVRRKNLVGVGDTGVLTTRTKNKRLARRMEQALVDVAERALVEPSYRAVLEAVVEKRLPLPDLLSAHARGAVGDLRTSLVDPPLAECFARYVERAADERKQSKRRNGASIVLGIAPTRARLSWIRDARNVAGLLHAAERGEPADADGELSPRHRNTVHRHVLRAVSGVLRAELGQAERDRVLGDVDYAAVDDTREVALAASDVRALLDACDAWERKRPGTGYRDLRAALRLMLQTSADRGVVFHGRTGNSQLPAPGLTVGQVRVWAEEGEGGERYVGTVHLADKKTKTRERTVPLTDGLCRELLPFLLGKGPGDQVFGLTYPQVDVRWKRVRETAGLPHLRLKDLRAQTAIAAERSGVALTVAQRVLGHGNAAMTRRYLAREEAMSAGDALAIERGLGLTG